MWLDEFEVENKLKFVSLGFDYVLQKWKTLIKSSFSHVIDNFYKLLSFNIILLAR